MAENIRIFIAIELEEAHHRALGNVQMRFQRDPAASSVRWVAPQNIHLTLKFLGDVDRGVLPALQSAVTEACIGIVPFTLSMKGVGAFPNTRRPNVLWVGLGGEVERAGLVAQRLDDACAAIGMPREEQPFCHT